MFLDSAPVSQEIDNGKRMKKKNGYELRINIRLKF
jgi:hypothetical protein